MEPGTAWSFLWGNTHQHLEEEGQQLAVGHEGAVQDTQVEPAAQAPEDFDEHLLLIARLLHTRHLRGHGRTSQDPTPAVIREK